MNERIEKQTSGNNPSSKENPRVQTANHNVPPPSPRENPNTSIDGIIGTAISALGLSNPQCGSGSNAVTVVIELGPETLIRLDRLLAVLEHGVSESESHQVKGLTQPLTLTSENNPCGHKQKGTSPYLDAEAAAEYLGINVKSLYGLVERRHLKPLRGPKRTYRFTKELLDEYLRSSR